MSARATRKVPKPSASNATGGLLAASPAGIVGWAWLTGQPELMVDVVLRAADQELGRARADDFAIGLVRRRIGGGVPGFVLQLSAMPQGPYPLALTLWSEAGDPLGEPLLVRDAAQLDTRLAAGAAAEIEGVLDGLNAGRITGWAWNKAAPHVALGLELHDGGSCVARAVADQYRSDLEKAGKRDGACGFCLDVPVALLDGASHSLQVRVAGHGIELPNSPISFGPLQLGALTDELSLLREQVARLAARVEQTVAPDGRFQTQLIKLVAERVAALGDIQIEMVAREMEALRAIHRLAARPALVVTATV